MTKHNRHSIEAAQRCPQLGAYVADDTADSDNRPLDLTTETRRLLDDYVLPAALCREPGELERLVGELLAAYEAKITRRRINLTLPEGVSYFDRFAAERSLITAVAYAAQRFFKPQFSYRALTTNSPDYTPEHALRYAQDGVSYALFFRVVSRWDNDRRAMLDYPAILTWLCAEPKVDAIHIQPVVVGSVGRDATCYEMPLTRRYVESATGQYWWAPTKTDIGGSTKRLGRSWRKEALGVAQTEEWIDEIMRADWNAEALGAVFAAPVRFKPSSEAIEHANQMLVESYSSSASWRFTRGCLFPNECVFLRKCWGG